MPPARFHNRCVQKRARTHTLSRASARAYTDANMLIIFIGDSSMASKHFHKIFPVILPSYRIKCSYFSGFFINLHMSVKTVWVYVDYGVWLCSDYYLRALHTFSRIHTC